jgi:hypothetical protein
LRISHGAVHLSQEIMSWPKIPILQSRRIPGSNQTVSNPLRLLCIGASPTDEKIIGNVNKRHHHGFLEAPKYRNASEDGKAGQ